MVEVIFVIVAAIAFVCGLIRGRVFADIVFMVCAIATLVMMVRWFMEHCAG